MRPPLELDDGAVAEVVAECGRVDGCGHEDESEVAIHSHQISHQDEHEVRIDIALVNLVDDDVRDAADARLHLAAEGAHGAEEDGTMWSWQDRLEAHRIAHRGAYGRLAALRGNTLRQGDGTDAPRLRHQDATLGATTWRQVRIQDELGYLEPKIEIASFSRQKFDSGSLLFDKSQFRNITHHESLCWRSSFIITLQASVPNLRTVLIFFL